MYKPNPGMHIPSEESSDYGQSDSEESSDPESDKSETCFRCGRRGHWSYQCYAKSMISGQPLTHEPNHTKRRKRAAPSPEPPRPGVYVLEYPDGRRYVGKSGNVERRLKQHQRSATHGRPHVVHNMTEGDPRDLESWERNETLTQMRVYGLQRVRGWKYTSRELGPQQLWDAEQQIREKFDLCRCCGGGGHFANSCPQKRFAKLR